MDTIFSTNFLILLIVNSPSHLKLIARECCCKKNNVGDGGLRRLPHLLGIEFLHWRTYGSKEA